MYWEYIYPNLEHIIPAVLDKLWIAVVFSSVILVVAFMRKGIMQYLHNRWMSNLRHYEGRFYGYRWSNFVERGLVEPTIEIYRRTRFSPFRIRWTTPDGISSTYPLIEQHGREIYAFGRNKDLGSYSTIIMHPSHSKPIDVVSGVYTFLNMSHQIVSGGFVMSRVPLTAAQVELLLVPTSVVSTQYDAYQRLLKYKEVMKHVGDNVIQLSISEQTTSAEK